MLGISVVVSSHILEDIEKVCDYVVILSGGQLMVSQPLSGIGTEQGDLLVRVDGDPSALHQSSSRVSASKPTSPPTRT